MNVSEVHKANLEAMTKGAEKPSKTESAKNTETSKK
jgi:hypothetical protein